MEMSALCLLGIECFFLFINTLSPSTALEPQLLKFLGLLKRVGFIKTQRTRISIGTREYHPIQTLYQTANTIKGNVANLVQIDHGLACFNQLSSSGKNIFEIYVSIFNAVSHIFLRVMPGISGQNESAANILIRLHALVMFQLPQTPEPETYQSL